MSRTNGLRPEIQALRALAVLLVVVYHLRPGRLTGGYVGVDVFFVISGFLITSHLFRELAQTGSIRLSQFYARRIRRLLPASFTVLLACAAFAAACLPKSMWLQTFSEIAASAVYGVNWLLARNSVDYLAAANDASLVQHYWSLSVEEQFYIVWPGLILAAVFMARRFSKVRAEANPRRFLIPVILGLFILSIGLSVVLTTRTPTYAYFITPTRVWEFAAGGLLALLLTSERRWNAGLASLMSGSGLAIILASAWLLNDESAFPGWLALAPVAGTALVIWAGRVDHLWSPSTLMNLRPVQLLGDISYGVYLWHWPLIVAYPYVRGVPPGLRGCLIIVALSLVLAWFTKVLIEDPVRTGRFWLAGRRRAYGLAVAGSLATLLVSGAALVEIHDLQKESRRPSFASMADIAFEIDRSRTHPTGSANDRPGGVGTLAPEWIKDGCLNIGPANVDACRYGPAAAAHVAAVIGDSVAASYVPTIRAALEPHGWQIQLLTWQECPVADVRVKQTGGAGEHVKCDEHRPWVYDRLAAMKPDMIIGSDNVLSVLGNLTAGAGIDTWTAGAEASFARLTSFSDRVVILEAPARPNCQDTPQGPCQPGPDVMYHPVERRTATRFGITYVDTAPWLCQSGFCPDVIDFSLVRGDRLHLTENFARRLDRVFLESISKNGYADLLKKR